MLISFLQLLFAILKMIKYDVFTSNPLPHEKLLIMSKRKCMIKSNQNHCLSWNYLMACYLLSFKFVILKSILDFHLIRFFIWFSYILESSWAVIFVAIHFVSFEQNLFQKQKGFWLLMPWEKKRPNFFLAFRQVLKKVLI